ncbi:hypothetical protein EV687_1020 [Corticibacter populi]|nr:hypothetical protein EV687_1020 [Corticibacter populi]
MPSTMRVFFNLFCRDIKAPLAFCQGLPGQHGPTQRS